MLFCYAENQCYAFYFRFVYNYFYSPATIDKLLNQTGVEKDINQSKQGILYLLMNGTCASNSSAFMSSIIMVSPFVVVVMLFDESLMKPESLVPLNYKNVNLHVFYIETDER